jgi:NAD(P)-dependent dehydrogenase (short-subunit alcohol dehydrogenase family)
MSVLTGSDLSGRTALIVGGGSSGGIGFATAEAMAAAGARIALADLATSEVKATAKGLPSQGGHAAFTVDVTDPQSVSALVASVSQHFGAIDILVNAAGTLIVQPFLEIDPASWERTFAVNTRGQFLVAQAVARNMVARGEGGRIILIASNVGRTPRINNSSYAASKAAVIHLGRAMALEISKHDITVNVLCPGSTATTMLVDNQAGGDRSRLDGIIHGSLAQWRTGIPLGRLCEPADQAAICVFLASEGARQITGQAVCVDGGQTLF